MKTFKITIICLLFSTFIIDGNCQIIQKNGSVYDEVATIISNLPGSSGDDYKAPSLSQLNTWHHMLNNVFSGNYNEASDSANTIGYELIHLMDTSFLPSRTYYILETIDSNYWGTYVYYPDYCRPIVIQSPHSKRDTNTGHQGIWVFKATKAMFYYVNGTHRCNSSIYTSCTGTTTGCSSSSEPYRISDLAHETLSVFQKTTEILFNNFANAHFIQLHGFSKLSTDPYVVLSNGTQITPTPDYLSVFKTNLFDADPSLTFKIAHIDISWTRLRGFFNVQGRLINTSPNTCNANATTTNGRFFHIEQEKTKLRNDSTGWNKIVYAVSKTFPCNITSTSPIIQSDPIKIYPNPTTNSITIESTNEITTDDLNIYNQLGQNQNHLIYSSYENPNKVIVNMNNLPSGFYILRVKSATSKVYKQ
jgi:hypothetical protein